MFKGLKKWVEDRDILGKSIAFILISILVIDFFGLVLTDLDSDSATNLIGIMFAFLMLSPLLPVSLKRLYKSTGIFRKKGVTDKQLKNLEDQITEPFLITFYLLYFIFLFIISPALIFVYYSLYKFDVFFVTITILTLMLVFSVARVFVFKKFGMGEGNGLVAISSG